MKMTLVYSMKTKTRRQIAPPCLMPARSMHEGQLKISATLCMSSNDHKSTTNTWFEGFNFSEQVNLQTQNPWMRINCICIANILSLSVICLCIFLTVSSEEQLLILKKYNLSSFYFMVHAEFGYPKDGKIFFYAFY